MKISVSFLAALCICCFFFLPASNTGAQTVRNDAVALYNRGLRAFQNDQILDSIRYYQQAIEYNENYTDAYRESARSFYYLGESDEAERYIIQAIDLSPNDNENLNMYGRVLVTLGKVEEAELIFRRILESERFNIDARIGLGELSLSQGNIIQAREYYRASLDLVPEDHRVLLSLAFIYRDQGRISLAEDYVVAAISADSQNPWSHYYAADFYMLAGDVSKAASYARTSLLLQPGFLPALEILSRIYVQRGEYELAMSTLQQLDINTLINNEIILFTRSLAEYNSNNADSALRTLGSLLRDNPDNEFARLLLEDILLNEKGFDDPQRLSYAEFHFTRAGEYAQRNQQDSAQYHYNRGLTLSPFSTEGRRAYARFFREISEYARYLNQLTFLKNQLQVSDTELNDDLEIYNDLLRESVSQSWNVDQFVSERDNFRMVFFIQQDAPVVHSSADRLIASHLMDQLYTSSRIEFIVSAGISDLRYEPIQINSKAEGFSMARSENADYYIILKIHEREGSVELNADLHLGRTGRNIQSFKAIRSGNTRIKDSVLQLSDRILQTLPVRGRILQRNFETALVNLGANDGLSEGSDLQIIKLADISLHTDSPDFLYRDEDVLGTARVSKTDVFISQVELIPVGFFDNINIGDAAFVVPDREQDNSTNGGTPFPGAANPLYERVRTIR